MARTPHPSKDMAQYLKYLLDRMMLPYPAINDALGVERGDVQASTRVMPDGKGALRFQVGADTDIVILVLTNGQHGVGGHLNGSPLPAKRFVFEKPSPGFHRGVQGKITNYIEDNFSGGLQYKVYSTGNVEVFQTLADLTAKYTVTGQVTSPVVRKDLQGQPHLAGLAGPMWDGRKGKIGTIRYETQEISDLLSR